jgi:hypothetical protein
LAAGWLASTDTYHLLAEQSVLLTQFKQSLTNSLPKGLQGNALQSSHIWFLTGHSTPKMPKKMLAYGNYFPAGAGTTETIR